jgi:hypothetical protein
MFELKAATRLKAKTQVKAAPVDRKYFQELAKILGTSIVPGKGNLHGDYICVPASSIEKAKARLKKGGWTASKAPSGWIPGKDSLVFARAPGPMYILLQPLRENRVDLFEDDDKPPAAGDYIISAPLTTASIYN